MKKFFIFLFCRMAKEHLLDWYPGALLALDQSYLVFTPISQIMWHGSRVSWTDINIAKKAQKLLFIFIDMLYTTYLHIFLLNIILFAAILLIFMEQIKCTSLFWWEKNLPSHSVIYIHKYMNEIHSTTTGCWENNNKQRSSAFFL